MKNIAKGIIACLIATIMLIAPSTVAATSATAEQTISVIVPEFVGFDISTNNLQFNCISLGTTMTTPEYSINNMGNVPIDLGIQCAGDFNGAEQISPDESSYSLMQPNGVHNVRNGVNTIFKTGLSTQRHGDSSILLRQQLTIPPGVLPGTYSTTVTYTATKSAM